MVTTLESSSRRNLNEYDANQKRRRLRGGKARRIWRRFASENPTLAILLTIFVGLSLLCIMVEQINNSSAGTSGGVYRHSLLAQRMKRAKALLHQASGGGGSRGRHQQEEEEEEEGDDEGGDDDDDGGKERVERRRRRKKRQQQQQRHQRDMDDNASEEEGDDNRHGRGQQPQVRYRQEEAQQLLQSLNHDVTHNADGGVRWIAPYLMLPPLAGQTAGRQLQAETDDEEMTRGRHRKEAVNPRDVNTKSEFFKVKRSYEKAMAWEDEYYGLKEEALKPPVDYATHAYEYPELLTELPDLHDHGSDYPSYPPLDTLGDLMKHWPQDEDFPGAHERPIREKLLHFNYSNPYELELARKFRDAELPFKLYDIPEVKEATQKWTDDYVSQQFDSAGFFRGGRGKHNNHGSSLMDHLLGTKPKLHDHDKKYESPPAMANGQCQESANNFFAFFQPNLWDVPTMGLPPVRNNDWSFEQWAKHAHYADATALNPNKPHFYWQSGVPREERHQPYSQWTFISRDLPSLSSPKETFFVFEPESQKGIQCRFGERGVVAATHYDSGRNMIAMVTGAKRYILAPPKECPSLGIVPWKFNAVFRHSLLNFGHINHLNDTTTTTETTLDDQGDDRRGRGHHGGRHKKKKKKRQWKGDHMSQVEREWMEIAASSKAVETVLKAGEVLYIPSHWFHYIVSLQKSAQCNVRSGVHDEGTPAFGGKVDVKTCGRLSKEEAMEK